MDGEQVVFFNVLDRIVFFAKQRYRLFLRILPSVYVKPDLIAENFESVVRVFPVNRKNWVYIRVEVRKLKPYVNALVVFRYFL